MEKTEEGISEVLGVNGRFFYSRDALPSENNKGATREVRRDFGQGHGVINKGEWI